MRILILCTGNSCRSQMAHGFLKSFDPSLEVFSAGTEPAERVNPLAVEAMREAGIDISAHTPHDVREYLDQPFDYVITVCGGADESCPAFTGKVGRRLHIGFDDPAGRPMAEFRRVRDEIKEKFMAFYQAEAIKKEVREKYGAAALRVHSGGSSCCGAAPAGGCEDPITSNLYGDDQKGALPEAAVLASLGCGNPTALAELHPGEVVLDLGSGGGIDVLLSARRVGPEGKAYGLDMTDEMLALARENQRKAGVENVEFLKGDIENIPLPDSSVDVIISNCVINLAADKSKVLREAFRVLKPGGRFAVSDVVTRGDLSPEVRRDMELWVGCIAGALDEKDYLAGLRAAGFEAPGIEVTREYKQEQLGVDGQIFAGFIRARKPASAN